MGKKIPICIKHRRFQDENGNWLGTDFILKSIQSDGTKENNELIEVQCDDCLKNVEIILLCAKHSSYNFRGQGWRKVDQYFRSLFFEKNGYNIRQFEENCDECYINQLKLNL